VYTLVTLPLNRNIVIIVFWYRSQTNSQRKKRKREDRPDVFDHLAQLRRKQHRFEIER